VVCFNATTLWHSDAEEWAPSTASLAEIVPLPVDFRFAAESGRASTPW